MTNLSCYTPTLVDALLCSLQLVEIKFELKYQIVRMYNRECKLDTISQGY